MPQPIGIRFGIGLYQVGQAKGWDNGPAAWQGYASAAMHWIMVGEHFGLPLESSMAFELAGSRGGCRCESCQWPDIRSLRGHYCGDSSFLNTICRAQQQLIYGIHSGGSTRKSRYDKSAFTALMGDLIHNMIVCVPPTYRATAFHDEMQILVGDLVKVKRQP